MCKLSRVLSLILLSIVFSVGAFAGDGLDSASKELLDKYTEQAIRLKQFEKQLEDPNLDSATRGIVLGQKIMLKLQMKDSESQLVSALKESLKRKEDAALSQIQAQSAGPVSGASELNRLMEAESFRQQQNSQIYTNEENAMASDDYAEAARSRKKDDENVTKDITEDSTLDSYTFMKALSEPDYLKNINEILVSPGSVESALIERRDELTFKLDVFYKSEAEFVTEAAEQAYMKDLTDTQTELELVKTQLETYDQALLNQELDLLEHKSSGVDDLFREGAYDESIQEHKKPRSE